MSPVTMAMPMMIAGNSSTPDRNLLVRILRSLTGIDFQKNIALLRRSALKASPK